MSATVFFADAGGAELATLTNTFSVSGTPTDPAAVSCKVTDPAGNATVHTYNGASPADITKTGTGAYALLIPCTLDGIWVYKWIGTGTASDVAEGTWIVGPSDLTQNYCTAEELKSRLQITGTADNSEIAIAVASASRAVDGYCERYFYRATDTRTYVPFSLYETRVDDLVSVSALATDPGGTTAQGGTFPVSWAASDYQLLPYNPGKTGEQSPYTKIRAVGTKTFPWVVPMILMRADRVQVTGVFGWPAVPQAVRTATLITAAELFKLKDAPLGVAGGDDLALAAIGSSPRIGELLTPYVRNPFLAA